MANDPDPEAALPPTVIMARNKDEPRLDVRLYAAIHGTLNPSDKVPCSLLVFKFNMSFTSRKSRIEAIDIRILFESVGPEGRGPEVLTLAPQGSLTLPSLSRDMGGLRLERSLTQDMGRGMRLQGVARLIKRNWGGPDSVSWKLSEDGQLQHGVSGSFTGAVLLRRQNDQQFTARLQVKAEKTRPLMSFAHFARGTMDFDPTRSLIPEQGFNDWADHLGDVDLNALASLRTDKGPSLIPAVPQPPPPEEPPRPPTIVPAEPPAVAPAPIEPRPQVESPVANKASDLSVEEEEFDAAYGLEWQGIPKSDKNRIFASFASGGFGAVENSMRFRRFRPLHLLSLFTYQQRLLDLEQGVRDHEVLSDDDHNALAKLLREYAEALRTFKELEGWASPSATDAEYTAKVFQVMLADDRYQFKNAQEMVDLNLTTSVDSVRNAVATGLMSFHRIHEGGLSVWLWRWRRFWQRRPQEDPVSFSRLVPPEVRPREIANAADSLARFIVAGAGVVFLVAPLYNLVYVSALKYQLMSVVLWLFVFAISLAASSSVSNQELLAAIAGYAAVLVVFVGQGPSA
ncbi:hypothetical protein Z517_11735 [Fonsecaea pedrosoi CBS 271.37]|uniref:DUF6594 domain-containing protein n=1 Tax=Fonsecaea pedrosoi CBS 271.37 TaxID=1442368 RepID=A0A0D2GRA9_9EURO|nr:uncharacterized protein Z517_11735 [Fonsecaea pedrosoi CBS 271.37]KIW74964.1 hypothetical protein Z517_11735 [Fonsecaea pedrosoi CBS 271.37]